MNKNLPDRFVYGVVAAVLSIALIFLIIKGLTEIYQFAANTDKILDPPKPQLIALSISMLLFRNMIVAWNRVEMARGFFFTLFIITMIYLLNAKFRIATPL